MQATAVSIEWRKLGPALAGVVACAVLGWFALGRRDLVPLLSGVDLGFHELGHMLAMPLPTMAMFLAGSFAQIAVPLSLAAYFGLVRREAASAGVMLAWAATSMQSVSVYIADAPYQRLPLIGGQHDWAYLLGPNGWQSLRSAQPLADAVFGFGAVVLFAGIALCLTAVWEASGLSRPRPMRIRNGAGPLRVRPARAPNHEGDPR